MIHKRVTVKATLLSKGAFHTSQEGSKTVDKLGPLNKYLKYLAYGRMNGLTCFTRTLEKCEIGVNQR